MLILASVAAATALVTGAALARWGGRMHRALKRVMLDQLPLLQLGPNEAGISAEISPVGASILRLVVPAADGSRIDVALGFERSSTYALLEGGPYFGALVGRCANRIAQGKFTLDGREYTLATNNGPNALHGGVQGFNRRVWKAKKQRTKDGEAVVCTYTSKDGEEGYPGTASVTVTYELPGALPELRVSIRATTDKATPVNLAQHTYFNLAGHDSGTILGHVATINATHYTPVDATQIPTGEVVPVEGTPFDFREPHAIGERIGQIERGYDHNYALFGLDASARHIVNGGSASPTPRLAAEVMEPSKGVRLRILTTAPGMQFYTGGFLGGDPLPDTKAGAHYPQFGGFAMETQGWPDAINKQAFPSVVLRPGEEYVHDLVYQFGLADKV